MLAHSLILTLSAAAVIKTFYLIPKKEGLIMKFEFNTEVNTEIGTEPSERAASYDRLIAPTQ